MSLCECVKNQGRTWQRLLIVFCVLFVLLLGILLGVGYHVVSSSAREVKSSMGSREDLIAEFMGKHQNMSAISLAKFSNGSSNNFIFELDQNITEEVNSTFNEILIELESEASEFIHPLDIWAAPEEIQKAFPYYLSGYDNENRPVWVLPFGTWNVKQYMDDEDEEYEKIGEMYGYQLTHRINQTLYQPGKNGETVRSWAFICDMDCYSYGQFTSMATVRFLIKMAQIFRPMLEEMEYGFLLNLDWVSRLLINVIKPFMSTDKSKFTRFGTDQEEYSEALLERIPATQLPQIYGGTSENFEPVASYG